MKQLIFFLILATTISYGQPRWMDRDDDDDAYVKERGRFIEELKLTDDQEDQVKQFRSDFQKKNIELRADIQTMRVTLRDLFNEDKPSQSKIESQLTAISKTQNELKLNATSFWFKVNNILKPDQQEIWKEHRQMMKQGFNSGRGKGKGFGNHGGIMRRDGYGRGYGYCR